MARQKNYTKNSTIQMNNKKIDEKIFKPIYSKSSFPKLQIPQDMRGKVMDIMYYLQLLILILVLHMLFIVKIKTQIIY